MSSAARHIRASKIPALAGKSSRLSLHYCTSRQSDLSPQSAGFLLCSATAASYGSKPLSHTTAASARRFLSTPNSETPATITASGFTTLPSRRLVAVSGQDAAGFLQGLTTANIPSNVHESGPESIPSSLYTAFLNAQGRILLDAFIYPLTPSTPLFKLISEDSNTLGEGVCFLIETDSSNIDALVKWLRRYKLRSKVQISPLGNEKLSVSFFWDQSLISPHLPGPLRNLVSSGAHAAMDQRTPNFGVRVLASTRLNTLSSLATSTPQEYALRRYLHGLPEGPDELLPATALVHDSNLDKANAVDFRKGCYVGQELVIRTQHIGVVRKRVLPVVTYPSGQEPPVCLRSAYRSSRTNILPGAEIWRSSGHKVQDPGLAGSKQRGMRPLGRMIAQIGNIGIASVRLEPTVGIGPTGERLDSWNESKFLIASDAADNAPEWGVKAFLPAWF